MKKKSKKRGTLPAKVQNPEFSPEDFMIDND